MSKESYDRMKYQFDSLRFTPHSYILQIYRPDLICTEPCCSLPTTKEDTFAWKGYHYESLFCKVMISKVNVSRNEIDIYIKVCVLGMTHKK